MSSQRRWRDCLAAFLLGAFALPAIAAAPVAQAPEVRLEAAMAGFTRSAIEKLAASESPRERWIAGLLLLDESMRAGDGSDALRERARGLLDDALKAGGDDATLLFWALLDPPMRQTAEAVAATAQARLGMLARLQRLGADVLEVPPDAMGAGVVEAYLGIKRAGSL